MERLDRTPPAGDPEGHWVFSSLARYDVPERFTLEIRDGVVTGDYGANITPGGTLDYETSGYFGIRGWREHPLFLRSSLPPVDRLEGSLVALGTRGGSSNYYHFLLDVLPRWGIFQESCPGLVPDHLFVPNETSYQRELLALLGLDTVNIVAPRVDRAVSADRVYVPALPNPLEIAPSWIVEWTREQLPAVATDDKPKRLYVTRGSVRHTRRLVDESEMWPMLERRGFTRIDAGELSVRDQIDHFAAADVIVGLHGAALTNLVFCRPGAKVLNIFAPNYVKHCFWAICDVIPDVTFQYLVGEGPSPGPGRGMNGIQRDIRLAPDRLEQAVDRLIGA